MVDAVDEEADERRGDGDQGGGEQGRGRAGERGRGGEGESGRTEAEDDEAEGGGEEPFGDEVFDVPRPRGAVRGDHEKVERIAEHGLALGEERDAAGVVAIPERELALGEGAALHHGERDVLPHDGPDVGAFDIGGLTARVTGERRVGVVKQDGAEVG